MLKDCKLDLANWDQMPGQNEYQRKVCLQCFCRGWAGKVVGHAESQEVACTDHTRDRSNVVRLSRCLQTGLSGKEGNKLMDDERGQLFLQLGTVP